MSFTGLLSNLVRRQLQGDAAPSAPQGGMMSRLAGALASGAPGGPKAPAPMPAAPAATPAPPMPSAPGGTPLAQLMGPAPQAGTGIAGGGVAAPSGTPRMPLAPVAGPTLAAATGGGGKPTGPARMMKRSPAGGAPRAGGLPPLVMPNRSGDFFAGMKRPADAARDIRDPLQSQAAEAKFRAMMNRKVGPWGTIEDIMRRDKSDPDAQRFLATLNELNSRTRSGGTLSDAGGMLNPQSTRGR